MKIIKNIWNQFFLSFNYSLVQLNINAQLDILSAVVKDQIQRTTNQDTTELDKALKTINAIKARVTVLANVLQSTQTRLTLMSERVAAIEPEVVETPQQS